MLAWEDHELTRRCVASIAGKADLVLVDNGSHSPHKEELLTIAVEFGALLVRAETNLGFAGGMNAGLKSVTTEYVIFANNDLVVVGDAIDVLLQELQSASVGATFPKTLDENGCDTTSVGHFLTLGRAVAIAFGLNYLFPRLGITASSDRFDWLTGPFVAMRTALAKDIGGIPSQSFFYSEDYRLCWTLSELGYDSRLVPRASVVHKDDASARKIWNEPQIAQNQTRELVRAAVDQYSSRFAGRVLARCYYVGCRWRAIIQPSPTRKAVACGAREAIPS